MWRLQTHFPEPSDTRCIGWGMRLRKPPGTPEAEGERGSRKLGVDILLTVTLGTPVRSQYCMICRAVEEKISFLPILMS